MLFETSFREEQKSSKKTHLFIHSNKLLLSTYDVPKTNLGRHNSE